MARPPSQRLIKKVQVDRGYVPDSLRGAYEAYDDLDPQTRQELDEILERADVKFKVRAKEHARMISGQEDDDRIHTMFGPVYALELVGALLIYVDRCKLKKRNQLPKELNPDHYHGNCSKCQVRQLCDWPDRHKNGKRRNGGIGETK